MTGKRENQKIKIISALILTIIIIVFLYSETGILSISCEAQNNQDYCEIIKKATTKISKYNLDDIFSLDIYKSVSQKNIVELDKTFEDLIILFTDEIFPPKESTIIYLFNRTFLI